MNQLGKINFSAFAEHRKILKAWLSVIFIGLLIFLGLLIASYFILNEPSIAHNHVRYKRAESALGFSELGGLALSVIASFRYLSIKNKYHAQVFEQFVKDNGWKTNKNYEVDKIASILLGAGGSYKEGYSFDGVYNNKDFSCLIFEYVEADTKIQRYICLSFKLTKSYPMIVIDNRLNDHKHGHLSGSLPDHVPNGVELNLEGGFSKNFRVSTVKGYQQKTLEVLTPEFMAALEDNKADRVSLEINNKNVFLIYGADHYSEQNIESLFNMSYVVLNKFDRLSKTWLASSKGEEAMVAESAIAARHKLIFRSDMVGIVASLIIFGVFVALMISMAVSNTDCVQTSANTCSQTSTPQNSGLTLCDNSVKQAFRYSSAADSPYGLAMSDCQKEYGSLSK
jgi:hypothetical protein